MIKIYRCWYCKNFISEENDGMSKCKAYPNGIPLEVLRGEIDCCKNIDSDKDIRFEIDKEIAKSYGIKIEEQK